MGLLRAAGRAVGKGLADQWLEVYEPDNMGDQTVFTSGVRTRKGVNVKGTSNHISDGSVIRVYEGQFMMLVDGGRIIDYTSEPGYYTVSNESAPSLFSDNLDDGIAKSIMDIFERWKFGGETPREQKVYYINLQEIKGIKFGTRQPINYFDNFYNAELFIRAHGTYSVRIVNPLQFYVEAIPKNKDHVEITEINEQYMSEFMQALQSSINRMSAENIRISHVTGKTQELGKYMADVLDDDWTQMRGFEIQAVGIASISYDESSQQIIRMRNEAAVYSDPNVARGHLVGKAGEAMAAAGANQAGAMQGFLGMGMGMNTVGGILGQISPPTAQQPAQQPVQAAPSSGAWTCACGHLNTGKFCSECGKPMPNSEWTCACGHVNTGKFCSECGAPRG